MSFRRRHDLKLVRQSASWNQSDETRNDPVLGSVPNYHSISGTHGLIDNVHLSIMPYRGSKMKSFRVALNPANQEVEALLEESIGRRDQRDLVEAVSEFVRDCAALVMGDGKATYEIAYQHDENDKPVSFMLLEVHPGSVRAKGKRLVQYVPPIVARERKLKGNFIDLTPEKFVFFELPAYVRPEFEPMMNALAARSDNVFPDFVLSGMEEKGPRIPFDIEQFDRTKKMAVAQASKLIGWNGRFMIGSGFVTEYYQWHRLLLFERFKIELRDGIMAALNTAVERAGQKIGFAGQLVIEGLPTLADVQDAQEALATGSRTFGEILGVFRFN